jgi:hypothetical protein
VAQAAIHKGQVLDPRHLTPGGRATGKVDVGGRDPPRIS